MDLKITCDTGVLRAISRIASPDAKRSLHENVGQAMHGRVQDHLAQMSVSRHRTSDRLGAKPTGFLELAPDRTVLQDVGENGGTISIKNTPGLSRAYHDLEIRPKGGKKWLTIPISRISYGKRVADLKRSGHKVFRAGKARILAEADGGKETYTDAAGKRKKRQKIRPLYALVKSARIPRDPGLLPQHTQILGWLSESARDWFESYVILGGG